MWIVILLIIQYVSSFPLSILPPEENVPLDLDGIIKSSLLTNNFIGVFNVNGFIETDITSNFLKNSASNVLIYSTSTLHMKRLPFRYMDVMVFFASQNGLVSWPLCPPKSAK